MQQRTSRTIRCHGAPLRATSRLAGCSTRSALECTSEEEEETPPSPQPPPPPPPVSLTGSVTRSSSVVTL